MSIHPDNLIWIDLEMTGLDPDTHVIIEIATIVTDAQLNILEEGPSLAISQPEAELDKMDDWCTRQHNASGLVDRIRSDSVSIEVAESATLDFLARWVPSGASPMCGNSICQDRRFLVRGMPALAAYFHYRNLDVSTLKELARRWAPDIAGGFTKESEHLALADIRDSINELRYYRSSLIAPDYREAGVAP